MSADEETAIERAPAEGSHPLQRGAHLVRGDDSASASRYLQRVFIGDLFAALESAGLEYAVVGGVAVNIHGVPRMTYDVDIVVATSEPSLRACREVLEGLGLQCRLPFALEAIAAA